MTTNDLEEMSYGDCIDYIDAYIDLHEEKEPKARMATQSDIDAFLS
ncbi:hypothetical protein [Ureibacillus xyleni]|nr:hypothetical protein [Ureibacillus xyleni]